MLEAPEILLLLVERWQYVSGVWSLSDSDLKIDTSLTLATNEFKLRGVVYHTGLSPLSRHYVAVACHQDTFFLYNDSTRREFPIQKLTSNTVLPGDYTEQIFTPRSLLYERV